MHPSSLPPAGANCINDPYVQAMVEEINDKTINIYPNPANAYFVVYNYTASAGGSILLTDVNGRTLRRTALKAVATRNETGELANGLYVVTITDAKGKVLRTKKIIIQK